MYFVSKKQHLINRIDSLSFIVFLFFFTELFLLITVAHSQNCPPEFKFGAIRMRQQLGWGWDLALTSLFFLFIPCVVHFVESGRMYRSNSLKK